MATSTATFLILTVTDNWSKLPIAVSAIVAAIGAYMSYLMRQDTKKREEGKQQLDTIKTGQEWVLDALDRSEADNTALRERVAAQEQRIREQDSEISKLRAQVAKCTSDCAELRRAIGENP